ncbi:MAG: hypothetical protein AAF415_15770 [Pseudomonadota bacterium]
MHFQTLPRRLALGVLLLVSLAACAAKIPPPLTQEQRDRYNVDRVVVTLPAESRVWWGDGDTTAAKSLGVDLAEGGSIDTPEGQGALYDLARERMQRTMDRQVRETLAGVAPAQMSVVITNIHISSAAQQLLVGGNHIIDGAVQLYDLTTGEPLTAPQQMVGFGGGGSGIPGAIVDATRSDPFERVATDFANRTRDWISVSAEYELLVTESGNEVEVDVPGPAEDALVPPEPAAEPETDPVS